jgi:hypothetical protein
MLDILSETARAMQHLESEYVQLTQQRMLGNTEGNGQPTLKGHRTRKQYVTNLGEE